MSPLKWFPIAFVTLLLPLAAQAEEFSVSKIDFALQESPKMSGSGYDKKVTRPSSWLEVEVTFDWTPRTAEPLYLDDLTVNYYILLNNKNKDFPQGALLVGSVNHVNVGQGKELKSVMYVAPRSLERFFGGKIPNTANQTVAGIGVTITKAGQVVAESSTSGKGQWWTTYQQTQGYVLNKSETPFAHLAWDYFEAVKGRGAGQ